MITAKELFEQLKGLAKFEDLDKIGVLLSSCHCEDHECKEGLELIEPKDEYWERHYPTFSNFIRLD